MNTETDSIAIAHKSDISNNGSVFDQNYLYEENSLTTLSNEGKNKTICHSNSELDTLTIDYALPYHSPLEVNYFDEKFDKVLKELASCNYSCKNSCEVDFLLNLVNFYFYF